MVQDFQNQNRMGFFNTTWNLSCGEPATQWSDLPATLPNNPPDKYLKSNPPGWANAHSCHVRDRTLSCIRWSNALLPDLPSFHNSRRGSSYLFCPTNFRPIVRFPLYHYSVSFKNTKALSVTESQAHSSLSNYLLFLCQGSVTFCFIVTGFIAFSENDTLLETKNVGKKPQPFLTSAAPWSQTQTTSY